MSFFQELIECKQIRLLDEIIFIIKVHVISILLMWYICEINVTENKYRNLKEMRILSSSNLFIYFAERNKALQF